MVAKWNAVFLTWICLLVGVHSSEIKNVFGIFTKSSVFKCTLEPLSEVEWFDWAYSLDGKSPAVIYQDGSLNEDELHVGRFTVDTNKGHMTISNLGEDDVGTYICRNAAGEEEEFELALGNMPECNGQVSDLREDMETMLSCEMKYSGIAPMLEWLRETTILEDADDNTDIGTARRTVTIPVMADMDQQMFVCRAVVGDFVEECVLKFDVKYSVKDIMVSPELDAYPINSDVVCSAKGNPMPKVSATLPDGKMVYGDGMVTVSILEEWEEGSVQKITCQANNTVDTKLAEASRILAITVTEKSTSDGSGDQEATGASTQLTGIIAGVVIAAVILVIIIIIVVVVKKKKVPTATLR